MFLKKLNISKKELTALAIASGIFIIVLLLLISMLFLNNSSDYTDIDFFGYQFRATQTEVFINTPDDADQTVIEINSDTLHGLETLSGTINKAYDRWTATLRNSLIFIYLIIFIIIIFKKKETYLQGLFKGFLIGTAFLLLLYVIHGFLDVNGLLLSFSHDFTHLFYH